MICKCCDFPACEHRLTMSEFVKRYNVRIVKSDWTDRNPHMEGSDRNMNNYKVQLACAKRRMTLYYSMGFAHEGEPKVADVINCLASDASGVENSDADFEKWCGEYGYDTDSRRAERTFKACWGSSRKLKQLIGDEAYDVLLWHTEGL